MSCCGAGHRTGPSPEYRIRPHRIRPQLAHRPMAMSPEALESMKFSDYLKGIQDGHPAYVNTSSMPRKAEQFQGRPAGLLTRMIGAGVDVALVYVLVTLLDVSLRILDLVATPFVTVPIPPPAILVGIGFVIFWGYTTWSWSSLGRSLGDHVMGIRIETEDGASPGTKRAAVRSLAFIAFPPGLLWVPFSGRARSLQDLLVRTDVRYDWVTRVPPSSGAGSGSPSS
ncbi:MAG: RDD family protein [Chitinophagia bacterium]|nr:RDD family protein [Chitinophagia bacterium]